MRNKGKSGRGFGGGGFFILIRHVFLGCFNSILILIPCSTFTNFESVPVSFAEGLFTYHVRLF